MNKKLLSLILPALFSLSVQAAEDNRNYFGLAFAEMDASASTNLAPTGLMLRLGHRFSYDFGIEFHSGSAQSVSEPSIDRINSILLAWSAPYERFNLYTLVGMSRITYTNAGAKAVSDSTSYGLGARFDTSGPYTIQLEWMSYGTSPDLSVNSINLGFIRYF